MSDERTGGRRRVVVIGAGVSGLAAAHRLVETCGAAQLEVVLLEASSRPGGTLRTERRDGFLLEGGPDAFLSEKPAALELARRIGLGPRLIETNESQRRSFVARGNRLHPTPEGFQLLAPSSIWPFVASGIFSWRGKARMALDLLLPRRNARDAEADESLADFVRRRLGREALERMAQPMVGGIYTADPELLSLRATMPRFLDMERDQRSVILAMWRARRRAAIDTRGTSGARYSLFLTFDDGMQTLSDALAAALPPGTARLNTSVEAIDFDRETRRWHLRTATTPATGGATDSATANATNSATGNATNSATGGAMNSATGRGEIITADDLCLALPAYASARLLAGADAELAAELGRIPYASTATVNLGFRRADIPHALDGFGFVVPFVERRKTLACTFSSVKFAGRAPAGHALLRAFVGGALQPEMYALDEERMIAAVRADLRALLGIEGAPLFAHVEKWPRSMAQYHLGHLARVARISRRLRDFPTLQLAGNAYGGAGVPDCIRGGLAAAKEMLNEKTEFSMQEPE